MSGTMDSSTKAGAAPLKEVPELDVDPYAVEVLLDPYPFFRQIRDLGPVVKIKPHNVYVTGRYEESKTVLNDHERFMASAGIGIADIRKPGKFRIPNRLLENDPPSHTAIRAVLMRLLSPIAIRRWRDHFEKEAVGFVDRVIEMREFDGVEDLAEAYILRVFPAVAGVDLPRIPALTIGEMGFNQAGPYNELHKQAEIKGAPYLEWYENAVKRESAKPGSFAEMLFDSEARGELDEGIASNICRAFVRGGVDTTIAGIGFTLNQLARNPDQWAILKADPSKARNAFEEGIRHESPSYVNYRTTRHETELSGYRLDGDMKIGVFSGCANRDERFWPNPDKFDITRDVAGIHVAFGHGTHTCFGQMIARLEAECIIKEFSKRVKTVELAGEPRYRAVNQLHTLDVLPLRITV